MRTTLALALLLVGCGESASGKVRAPAVPPPPEPDPPTNATAVYAPLPTPAEEARQFLDQAKSTTDARERCQLIFRAVLLDGTSAEAHLLRAKNGCAPAKELLEDAKTAHSLAPTVETAAVLTSIATRAESSVDALAGAAALLLLAKGDVEKSRLAARTFARFGDHEKAARAFEGIASDRGAKGASLDALDARLDAMMESARCNGKGALATPRTDLLGAIQAAVTANAGYGSAWVGPKIVEAIAVLRTNGDAKGAADAAKLAREQKVIAPGEATLALDLERAIAEARGGNKKPLLALAPAEKKASRAFLAISRATLAVDAMLAGRCGAARTYAKAHAAIAKEVLPRFDDDVAWAATCAGGDEQPTLAKPPPSALMEDALSLVAIEPLRGRAALQKIVDEHPLDVAARLALIKGAHPTDRLALLDAALSKLPTDPSLRLARFDLLVGPKRGEEAAYVAKEILPKTIEVIDDPRAAAPIVAKLLDALLEGEATPEARADLAEAVVRSCTAPMNAPACVPPKDDSLVHATTLLRKSRPEALAKWGPSLPNADLADPRVRLDVVLALVTSNKSLDAELVAGNKRGPWDTAETALAYASILSASKKCELARGRLAQHPELAKTYADEVATVKKRCP